MLVDHIDGLPNLGRCETCGCAIIVYPNGTPRRYCGAVCRNAAKIKRREQRKEQPKESEVDEMSDTPLTDDAYKACHAVGALGILDHLKQCSALLERKFTELERELTAMTKRADEMERLKEHNGEMFYRIERELAALKSEHMKYRERAWHAESQLEMRYGLRKEISEALGLTDETGDDALRRGLDTVKALKRELADVKARSESMARVMIEKCVNRLPSKHNNRKNTCEYCFRHEDKSCPARQFLASNGAADAWSVK